MPRIFVAVRAAGKEGCQDGQRIDVDDGDAIRREMDEVLRTPLQQGAQGWCVLAYTGCPTSGRTPTWITAGLSGRCGRLRRAFREAVGEP